jgi:hypothetical protein
MTTPKQTLLALTLAVLFLMGFDTAQSTKSFVVKGKVKAEKKIEMPDLQKLTLHSIGSVNITSHKGDLKGKAKDMKGVLLREVLQTVELDAESPKFYSEYYFVCKGGDGYKVVYSWNELFNTAVGNSVYIILEKDGKNLTDDEDSLLMISSEDVRTGRRYVKNLEIIQVGRAE